MARPPTAVNFLGGPLKHQFMTSMLWMCCSQIWSPESQVKWYQLWHCHSSSLAPSGTLPRYQMPPPYQ